MAVEYTPGSSSGYEHREASIKLIVGSLVVLAICVVITCALTVLMFRVLRATTGQASRLSNISHAAEIPPEPRLQVDGWVQLENLRKHENQVLGTYGIDAETSTIHIPIDKAMDVLLQHGIEKAGGTLPPPAAQGGSPRNSGY